MKLSIESAIVSFINDQIAIAPDRISAYDPVQVVPGSGDSLRTDIETRPGIMVLIADAPNVAGNLSQAEINIVVTTPCISGLAEEHAAWTGFIESIFPPPIPPDVGLYSDAITTAIETETAGDYTANNYHVQAQEGSVGGDGRWVANYRIRLGLMRTL